MRGWDGFIIFSGCLWIFTPALEGTRYALHHYACHNDDSLSCGYDSTLFNVQAISLDRDALPVVGAGVLWQRL